MKIKTVAVLGAGAVGSYVIWGLSGRKDIRLGVIAEDERAKLAWAGNWESLHHIIEYTYHIIKALEEKNDGKFDYSKDKGQMTCAK